jgi:hypothetical protein
LENKMNIKKLESIKNEKNSKKMTFSIQTEHCRTIFTKPLLDQIS